MNEQTLKIKECKKKERTKEKMRMDERTIAKRQTNVSSDAKTYKEMNAKEIQMSGRHKPHLTQPF